MTARPTNYAVRIPPQNRKRAVAWIVDLNGPDPGRPIEIIRRHSIERAEYDAHRRVYELETKPEAATA